mgnify:CR=1 FL=1
MTRVLPGPRAREDEQRPVAVQHRFTLLGIEFVEEVHGDECLKYIECREGIGAQAFAGSAARRAAQSAACRLLSSRPWRGMEDLAAAIKLWTCCASSVDLKRWFNRYRQFEQRVSNSALRSECDRSWFM